MEEVLNYINIGIYQYNNGIYDGDWQYNQKSGKGKY